MNAALYFLSAVATASGLALTAWSWPRGLRMPGLSRIALGLAATPLVLAVVTLGVTLVWPHTPRVIILIAPGILTLSLALLRLKRASLVFRIASRHWHRCRGVTPEMVAVAALLITAGVHLGFNARQPVAAHDALIYLNEARGFAQAPDWKTYLAMVNPTAPDAPISGHTHTWLYSTFLAQALLATDATVPGAGHDLIARIAGQTNLLLLVVAVMGLAWAVTRRHPVLTIGAGAAAVCIPYVGYITASSSIDAFRILPLMLLSGALVGGLRRPGCWMMAATLAGGSAAAHTLNVGVVPLLLGARLTAGIDSDQWRGFRRYFLPAAFLCLLPVVAFYTNLWVKTGRILGHGLHYPFYAGSALEAVSRRGILSEAKPTIGEVWTTLEANYGWWVLAVSLLGLAGHFLARPALDRRFFAILFIASWLLLISGALPGFTPTPTRVLLGNPRYALAFWFLAIPLAAGSFSALPWTRNLLPAPARRPLTLLASAILLGGAWQGMNTRWPIRQSTAEELQVGELRVAAEVKRALRPGETWMTDRNTVAYYAARPGIFLYTPAGQQWIRAATPAAAWTLLCRHRVRLVALGDLNPAWWPGTPLHAALNQPGHTEVITLPRWRIYLLNLPDPESSTAAP